jgi:uncharacterized protein (DUF1697 family)
MTTQIALLRAINLRSHNKVSMASLRESVEALGYADVRTHLQSGNVVFTSAGTPAQAEREIADRLAQDLGLEIPVLVRTRDELAAVVEANPLGDVASNPARLFVTFLSGSADSKRVRELDPSAYEPDLFHVGVREIYAWHPEGVRMSRLTNAFWEKRLGVTATARNWNTVTRLLALAGG